MEIQSKAGSCTFRKYTLATAPLSDLSVLEDGFECEHCGEGLEIEVQRLVHVVVKVGWKDFIKDMKEMGNDPEEFTKDQLQERYEEWAGLV
jgi:hypothetical protein